jgi:hypothetical protein
LAALIRMRTTPLFTLTLACALSALTSRARAGENEAAAKDDEQGDQVTVHEFDPKTGVDAAQASKPTSVVYLNPGPILSLVGGRAPATGIGAEVSAMYFPTGTWKSFGYGAFTQAQIYDGKTTRFALGGQAALANAGVELGLAFRQGDDAFQSTLSVHGAIFLSVGFLVIAVRDTLPLNGFDQAHLGFGSETAFTFAIKLPLVIFGHDKTGWAFLGN